jgi:hypothetical protein
MTIYSVPTIAALQDLSGTFATGEAALVDSYGAPVNGTSVSITGATNASPIVITTATNHNFVSGQIVVIVGVQGNTAANNTWVVTVTSSTQFSLNGSTGNAAYTSGGTASAVSMGDGGGGQFYWEGPVPLAATITGATLITATITGASNAGPIVITTSGAHGLSNYQNVLISGVLGNTAANGNWWIKVTGTNTFTLNNSDGRYASAYTSGGTVYSTVVTTAAATSVGAWSRVSIKGISGMTGLNGTWQPYQVGPVGNAAGSTSFSIGANISGTYTSGGYFGDGGITVLSNTNSGRWVRSITNPVNARWYGAVGDGVTDDWNAFMAAVGACGNAAPMTYAGYAWPGRTLYIPPSNSTASAGYLGYYLSKPLRIPRAMTVYGDGHHGQYPATKLLFAKGSCGIIVEGVDCGIPGPGGLGNDGMGFAAGSIIRNLWICGKDYNQWSPSTFWGGFFHVWWQPAGPNVWGPGRSFSSGEIIVPSPANFGTTLDPNTPTAAMLGLAFQASGTGTLTQGSTEPVWPTNIGETVTDGNITWTAILAVGIWIQTIAAVHDCYVSNFAGSGIQTGPIGLADGCKISNCTVMNVGGHGINMTYAVDDAICTIDTCIASQLNGYAYFDCAQSGGNLYLSCQTQCAILGGYFVKSGHCINCYQEGGSGAIYLGAAGIWDYGVAGTSIGTDVSNGFYGHYRKKWEARYVGGPNPSTSYPAGSVVQPTSPNGYYYATFNGGSTGTTEPPWPLGRTATVMDGAVKWECFGLSPLPSYTTSGTNWGVINGAINTGSTVNGINNAGTPRVFSNNDEDSTRWFQAGPTRKYVFFGWQSSRDDSFIQLLEENGGAGWQSLVYGTSGLANCYTGAPSWGRAYALSTNRAVTAGTAQFAGQLRIEYPFYLGSSYYKQIQMGVYDGPPTGNTWILGSFVWNSSPTSNGILGWVCTVASSGGSAGTWSPVTIVGGRLTHNMASNADYTVGTASASEKFSSIIEITDSGSLLTATRNIILPTWEGAIRTVYNSTHSTSKRALVFKTSGGSSIVTVLPGQHLRVYCNGTDIVPAFYNGAGITSISTTGGATTAALTGNVIEVSGTLTSNATINLPNQPGLACDLFNNTTGAFTVTFAAAGGTGFTVASGKRARGYVDGSSAFVRVSADT